MRKLLLVLALLTMSVITRAECSKDEAMQAEATAAQLKSWNEVYGSYKKYSHCDDGAIAEGYSESMSQMFANHWDQFGDFEKLIKTDKKFENFVIKHIDQTIAKENAVKIAENARKHCAKKSKQLCKKIESASK